MSHMCKYDNKNPKKSVLNGLWQIPNCYSIRWLKWKLKSPKAINFKLSDYPQISDGSHTGFSENIIPTFSSWENNEPPSIHSFMAAILNSTIRDSMRKWHPYWKPQTSKQTHLNNSKFNLICFNSLMAAIWNFET